jgi:ubiquinone/menaquinone biosynthesis C-methylase UbiE
VSPADEYARIAPLYDAVVGPFLRPVHAALVDALCAVAGNGPVVDLCCGTGVVADMAAQAGLEAIGVDLSPAMLDRARARRGGASFLLGDATATGLDTASFAGCAISFALHEKPSETGLAMLAEARRLVAPGGAILVADYRVGRGAPLTGLAIAMVERLAGRSHHKCFSRYMEGGGSGPFLRRAGLAAGPVPGAVRTRFMGGWVGLYQAVV